MTANYYQNRSFSDGVDDPETSNCPAHQNRLVKHRDFTGNIFYTCPDEDCRYKVDEEGERIRK